MRTALAIALVIAAAAPPAVAQQSRSTAIIGLTKIELEGRTIDVYQTKPEGEGPWRGVVLAHDRMGVDTDTKRMADRLAMEGFVVIAPDLYHGKVALDADKGRELATILDENEATALLSELVAYLKFQPELGNHRAGLVGFDLGGRLVLLAGARSTDASAVAAIYGRPPTDDDTLRRISVPILAIFGDADDQISMEQVNGFKAGLEKAGRTSIVKVFPGAGHGFMKQPGESFKPEAFKEAWPALIAFLKENL